MFFNKVCQDLGADYVIDKSVDDLWSVSEEIAPDGYHIILDANGVSTLKGSYDHLRPGGKLVVYGFHSMMPKKGGKLFTLWNLPKLIWDWFWTPQFSPFNMTGENKSIM